MAIQVIGHFGVTHKLSIYGMTVWQFRCNVIWKFVEELFTYQKVPCENFCDLRFSRKSKMSDFLLGGALHISCMGWEVKIDMSCQSNGCLRVCNVKMKKILLGQKWGTSLRMCGLQGHSVNQFEFFFTGFVVPISLTVVDILWLMSTRTRWGTWVHTWSMYHCMYLG